MSDNLLITRDALEASLGESAFHRLLGLRLYGMDAAAKTVTICCPYQANVERADGSKQYHGGVIASLIDVTGDYALMAVLGYGVPTINLRVDYLRPARQVDLLACATVRRAGRTIGVVDIDVTEMTGQLIAVGRGCYSARQG